MRLERPSPAMLVALLALFVALGGVGYAAVTLPKNSVGAKQLKKSAITGTKIKENAVTSPKVKDFSLLANDFRAGELPAGPKGDKGDQGDQGAPGPTFGATQMGSATAAATDPVASPDETNGTDIADAGRHFDFSLPAGGRIFVRFFSPLWNVGCSSGAARGGLYLDGVPVPGSSHPVQNAGQTAELVAVVAAGAGGHSVEARSDCPAGTINAGANHNSPTWTVLLLGN